MSQQHSYVSLSVPAECLCKDCKKNPGLSCIRRQTRELILITSALKTILTLNLRQVLELVSLDSNSEKYFIASTRPWAPIKIPHPSFPINLSSVMGPYKRKSLGK
jgi:hypothetical protein